MIHLIIYSNDIYTKSKKRLYNEALASNWFDTITLYDPTDLDDKFKLQFQNILSSFQGGGFWIWKPYIVKKKLDEINVNDILIYLDERCTINNNCENRINK